MLSNETDFDTAIWSYCTTTTPLLSAHVFIHPDVVWYCIPCHRGGSRLVVVSLRQNMTDVFRQWSAGPATEHQAHTVRGESTGYSHTGSPIMDITRVCPQWGSDVWTDLREQETCNWNRTWYIRDSLMGLLMWKVSWFNRGWQLIQWISKAEFKWVPADYWHELTSHDQRQSHYSSVTLWDPFFPSESWLIINSS